MVSLKFSVILLCLLSLAIITQAQDPTYLYHNCPNTTTYTRNSTYQANLNLILSSLSSNATRNNINGFSNVSAGQAPDVVYGMFLCRGDVSNSVCRNCVNFATKDVLEKCPIEEVAMIWYDECELRYSNRNFFSTVDQNFTLFMMSPNNVTVEPDRFDQLVATTINNISAASGAKKFAVQQANYTGVQKLYTLVQCTPDLSTSDCSRCLEGAISKLGSCCNRKQGGRVKFPSCNFRYELYEFYNATPAVEAVPAPPLATPSPPPASGSKTSGKGNRRIWMIIILTVAGALLVVVILGSFIYCLMKRNGIEKWKKENSRQIDIAQGIGRPSRTDFQLQSFHRDGLDVQESSSMDLASIGKATNNFSSSNFIGKGGFGPVYKGILSDGKEVAVKRLSTWSGQGIREFTNEVRLIINLRHKNLVKLHGFYVDREEKLLVYEFMPNSSLDVLLFDPKKRAQLNWQTRIGIINGIAEGTLYLHEDSRRTIIHRDLKASNVLLDKDMNPKISDFGMARMFAGSEVETNTARIAGTFGYMAPEYAMEGLYSIKSDVFSFGVLLLEIITGKRNSGFKSKHASSLLAYAWSLWNEGHELELIDSLLADSCCSDEFSRYMHVGLLCVQEDFSGRPTMSSVVSMLKNGSSTLPKPKRPGFFAWTFTGHHNKANASKCSVNGLTISDILPR